MNKNLFHNLHKYVSRLLIEYCLYPADSGGALVQKITIRLFRMPFLLIVVDFSLLSSRLLNLLLISCSSSLSFLSHEKSHVFGSTSNVMALV